MFVFCFKKQIGLWRGLNPSASFTEEAIIVVAKKTILLGKTIVPFLGFCTANVFSFGFSYYRSRTSIETNKLTGCALIKALLIFYALYSRGFEFLLKDL